MQRIFATKVSAIGNDNKGRIYIDYYSRDDLDRLADLMELLKKKEITLGDLRNYNKINKNRHLVSVCFYLMNFILYNRSFKNRRTHEHY